MSERHKNDRALEVLFHFIKARNCSFEQQKCKQTKKEQYSTFCPCHVTLLLILSLLYPHQNVFFTWAFTPIG